MTANCWVKFAAPFVSVMVPAASSSSWLKSRLFSGSPETSLPESRSPPVPSRCSPCRSESTPSEPSENRSETERGEERQCTNDQNHAHQKHRKQRVIHRERAQRLRRDLLGRKTSRHGQHRNHPQIGRAS